MRARRPLGKSPTSGGGGGGRGVASTDAPPRPPSAPATTLPPPPYRQTLTRSFASSSPRSPRVLSVSAQVSKNALDVWGLDKESALHKFFVGEPMGVIAASPDGAHFAAGSLTGAAYIWEVSTGRLVRTWPAHFKAISAMTFAAEGSVLVTAGEDTVVSAWSLSSLLDPAAGGTSGGVPTPLHSWAEHSLPVTSLACGNGGGGGACLVASASSDRTCKLWTLGGGHLLRTVSLPAALCSVALDACEATLYAGAADGRVFEVPLNAAPSAAMDGAAAAVLEGHTRAVSAIACTADGERVVTASEDGTCRIFDAASRQTTHVLRHPKSAPFTAIVAAPKWRIAGDGAGAGAGARRLGGASTIGAPRAFQQIRGRRRRERRE